MTAALLMGSAAFAGNYTPVRLNDGTFDMSAKISAPAHSTNATRAESMQFSYAGEPYSGLGFNQGVDNGSYVYIAFYMSAEDAKIFAGNTITEMTVVSGAGKYNDKVNPNNEVQLFISKSLTETPEYTQDALISSTAMQKTTIKLDTPYEITGEPMVIGYRLKIDNPQAFYIIIDYVPTDNDDVGLAAVSNYGAYPASESDWTTYASQYGAACIYLTISGDKLPVNMLDAVSISSPACVTLGDKPQFRLGLLNRASNDVKDFELTVEATGEETYTHNVTLSSALASMKGGTMAIDLKPYTTLGEKDVTITISKVNGEENTYANRIYTTSTISIQEGYVRVPVIEEGTGNWCQYCPSGIVMMEYLKEKYGDKVARIAAHTGSSDPMAVESYATWCRTYASGVPVIVLNRKIQDNPGYGKDMWDDEIDDMINNPMFIKCELGEASFDEDGRNATFEGSVTSSLDTETQYTVSMALVEDGMGPFTQTNGYAGQGAQAPGDWGSKGRSVRMLYDDVARDLTSFPGALLTSEPMKAGVAVPYTFNVKAMNKVNNDNFRAIMMVSDSRTGEILNACVKHFTKSAVKSVINDNRNVSIVAGDGCITVSGAQKVAVYSMSGVKVAQGNAANIPAGIYIVKADNTIKKVIVK